MGELNKMVVAMVYNFLEIINSVLLYKFMLGIKSRIFKINTILFLLLSFIMCGVAYHMKNQELYNMIIPFFSSWILCLLITDQKKYRVIAFVPFSNIILGTVGSSVSLLVSRVINIPQNEVIATDLLMMIVDIIVLLILIPIVILFKDKIGEKPIVTKSQYTVFLIGGVSLYMMIGFSQYAMDKDVVVTKGMCELLEVFSLAGTVLFILLFFLYQDSLEKTVNYRLENERYNIMLNEQENYYQSVVLADERRRKLKHDMKSHMIALDSLAKSGEIKKVRDYIEKMEEFLGEKENHTYIGISAVDAIINEWKSIAENKGIQWKCECVNNSKIDMNIFELSILFSNLLKNAVEANDMVDGEKLIDISVNILQSHLVIDVKNTCSMEMITDKKPDTTKKDKENHGLGLKNVEEVVRKNDGEITYNSRDGVFEVIIIL